MVENVKWIKLSAICSILTQNQPSCLRDIIHYVRQPFGVVR